MSGLPAAPSAPAGAIVFARTSGCGLDSVLSAVAMVVQGPRDSFA